MSEQWKLVPVEPTREMLNGVCMHPDLARSLWSGLLKSAPQPLALGGEPEVVAVVRHLQTAFIDGKPAGAFLSRDNLPDHDPLIRQVDHRAHVTRLQAELSSANTDKQAYAQNAIDLQAEVERLKGLLPEWPPRPPSGEGLPRYGLRWNGPQQPLAVPMADGYWTPWHLADQLRLNAARYQFLRAGGMLAITRLGATPDECSILTDEDADAAIDAEMG